MSCLVAEPHAAALGRGRANPAASSSAAPSQRPHGTPTGRSRESQTVEHRADGGEPHTHPGPCHAAEHLRQRATPQRRWGRGGEPHTSRRRTTRIGPCLRRCEDGRGRLRRAGDHHVHDGSDYPCGGVCAKRLGSDLTTYRLETACTTTRTLPECNCHCFPCLLCVAPFGDMHSRLPPPPARRCVIRIFCFLGGVLLVVCAALTYV